MAPIGTDKNSIAEELIRAEDLVTATATLLEIIDSDPTDSRAYNNLGVISWKEKNWYDAYGLFRHAVELNPSNADATVNLFDAALKIKKIHEVEDLLRDAPNHNPDEEEVADIARGLDEEGDDIYFCMRALSEGFYHPDIEAADRKVEEGKLKEAMLDYINFIEHQGPAAEAFNGLGVISFYEGRIDDAFMMFFESLKLNPINRDTFLNFFDAARDCNRLPDAFSVFNVYREVYPHLALLEDELEEYRR